MRAALLALAILLPAPSLPAQERTPMSIPDDFPRFAAPGYDREMAALRELFWLHYPGAGPKATLWDEWLPTPSLWPAVDTGGASDTLRRQWNEVLSARVIDPEGYVATHQHASIAHPLGWPFPFWNQGDRGVGWHFSYKDTIGLPWRPAVLSTTEGWMLTGADDRKVGEAGWSLALTSPNALLAAPAHTIDTLQAPFLQIRWQSSDLDDARPYVEWATKGDPVFGPDRRVYFDAPHGGQMAHTAVPMYRHPLWKGEVDRLRIGVGNPGSGPAVVLQALFTQFDTRHNINSQNFVRGCIHTFRWTRDLDFLRRNINRMRTALRYVMTEHQALERGAVFTGWVGHDGRAGIERDAKGAKRILAGRGVGSNYWDLLPFGNLDAYATVQYYDTLLRMAELERDVAARPGWNIPAGVHRLDPGFLLKHAAQVKATGNRLFWSARTGRFAAGVDADGKTHDYGFTFLNLEAITYGFATPEHARQIMRWIDGERKVAGDTSQGADIYHWRFGPRATTRRNVDWYVWAWSAPESIAWGGQVQDGGAVLGFSYHDLMARLETLGPDSAWKRLQEVLRWFGEVQAAGGYRAYYNGTREGTLQGGGTAGGLGLDQEFFESVLVPQVMLRGFLGFAPTADGFRLAPRLPSDWPELRIDRIRLADAVLSVRASREFVEVRADRGPHEPTWVALPPGEWDFAPLAADGTGGAPSATAPRGSDGAVIIDWAAAPAGVRFERKSTSKEKP